MANAVLHDSADGTLLEYTLSFLDAEDIIVSALRVSHCWCRASLSDAVWSVLCERLWSDKVFVAACYRNPEPTSRRIDIYWGSIADASRTYITPEELCALTWHSRMKGWAGESWTERDPWWLGQPAAVRRFAPDGTTSSDKSSGTWRFVPDSCGMTGPTGTFVRMSRGQRSFPTHFVSRWSVNWGWILQNCWGFSASFPLPPLGSEPELEDDGTICQSVTVETCEDEARRFNLGLPLPHDDYERADDDGITGNQIQLASVMINGEAVQIPIEVLLTLLQRANVETNGLDDDDGDDSVDGGGEGDSGDGGGHRGGGEDGEGIVQS
eukprot:CAMPEP_0119312252 /NCGR_PEP_ID=MMETSP1333-20130426/25629_1 /TAXON_ID=418940 /ORGANISM="Scyphosphaera apsteinii, Strain RCC1455" /LENGTH=323 /DNA_ID=CAMNT_0007316845 /DNA_START=66 /DNA_END=1037 /DNA_ORIENTATION=-